MFATLDGGDTLDRRLGDLPLLMRARMDAKARDLAEALAARVRDDKLSGQALATRSGALKASISAAVISDGDALNAIVGSNGDVKYAAILEHGGRTSAHEILPDKGQALAFFAGGALRFARRIEHPGSSVPARAYLLTSLEEARDGIVAGLSAAVTEAWSNP